MGPLFVTWSWGSYAQHHVQARSTPCWMQGSCKHSSHGPPASPCFAVAGYMTRCVWVGGLTGGKAWLFACSLPCVLPECHTRPFSVQHTIRRLGLWGAKDAVDFINLLNK